MKTQFGHLCMMNLFRGKSYLPSENNKDRPSFSLLKYLILLCLCQCAVQGSGTSYLKDGSEYGKVRGTFRHRWWNYYERGLSFADGEFYLEAVADFKQAIRQRTEDQRMARTYGMHFIDYFPHRELGVVYYELGDFEAARMELELSLVQFPSAKAHYYLDRVRKALIKRTAKEVSPPRLTLDSETVDFWTREDPVLIAGVAEDEHYVTAIRVAGLQLFTEFSQKRITFAHPLDLPQGRHVIEVAAENLLGKVARRRIVIQVDRQGPILAIDQLHFDQTTLPKKLRVSGSIYDEGGVASLNLDGQSIPIGKGVEIPFSIEFTVGGESLELVATDRLGNQTTAQILLTASSATPTPRLIALADTVSGHSLVGIFGPTDTRLPDIRLKGWTDSQTVFLEKVYIDGQVSDENEIVSLTVNGIPILRRFGRHIFFNHLADLDVGENALHIEARDKDGNTARKTIIILRRVPKALQLAERLSLVALPFDQRGEISEVSFAFQDNLIDALVNRNRFQVIEREKLEFILREQKLSRTKLFDRSTALQVGGLVAAEAIVTGSIIETRIGMEVVARMVDTETSEILTSADVYGEFNDLQTLRSLSEGLAIKLHRDFPLVHGLVLRRKDDDIFTDLGGNVLKLKRRLIVYREEPIEHPVTGKLLGSDTRIIGHARVTQVMPEMSKAELVDDRSKTVEPLDGVITE